MQKVIRHSDECKPDAVSQVLNRDYGVQEGTDRLEITITSLYDWKTQLRQPKAESDNDAELRRLKLENAHVTEERDI